MKYLDERIYITVTDLIVSFSGLYKYKVIETGEDELLFIGNLFLEKDQTSVTIDITDIVRTYLSGKKDHHSFYVNLSIHGDDDYSGVSEVVLPFYRYPNRKADDINYDKTSTTYNTILLSGKSKTVENLFEYQDNLLPTYPKLQTDKVSINYLYGLKNGTGTDSFVFDYGPTQTITDSLTTYIKSMDASLTATGSVTNLEALTQYSFQQVSVYNDDATVSYYKGNLKYSYTTTIQPDEITYEWMNGSSDTKDVTTFPYSLTITESNTGAADDWINDFYVRNTGIDEYLINTYPFLSCNGKYTGTTVCNITEDLVAFPSKGITWDGWLYFSSFNIWQCNTYTNMTSGTTVSVRFTDTGGTDVVEVDAAYDGTNPITWEWNQLEGDLDSATIYINDEFTTEIPLSIVNNISGDDDAYKTLFFTLNAYSNGKPYLTITYGEYTINITYQDCTVELPVGLSNEIKIYKNTTARYIYTKTDDAYTTSVSGDLNLEGSNILSAYSCKNYRYTFWQNGVCKGRNLGAGTGIGWLNIPQGPIGENDYILVEYFDTDSNYHSGKAYLHPTNSKSNAYYYARFYSRIVDGQLNCDFRVWGGYTIFGHYTDNSITIGKLTCPNKYFLLWQDRLGSQQCQPFDKVDTYSEDIEGSEITNYYDKRSLYKVEIQPKWKLQTGWISDAAYRCYEGLFVSPWIKLYDGDSDLLYDVILKDRNYTEKNFLNQGKMFNLEVTVEQTEKQNILY